MLCMNYHYMNFKKIPDIIYRNYVSEIWISCFTMFIKTYTKKIVTFLTIKSRFHCNRKKNYLFHNLFMFYGQKTIAI